MTRAFEKASAETRGKLLTAMAMPVETEEEKAAKVAAVKEIYAGLEVEEEARQEIIRLHSQALSYVSDLGLGAEETALLENYAKKLIGRTK